MGCEQPHEAQQSQLGNPALGQTSPMQGAEWTKGGSADMAADYKVSHQAFSGEG